MTDFITRAQWGSRGYGGYPINRVSELIAHHTWRPDVPAGVSESYERQVVRSIEDFHVREFYGGSFGRGGGTGYQFLVFQSGRAYEGRGWFRSGAHTVGRNSKSVSICFVINGDEKEPSDKAWETARGIAAEGVKVGALTPDYKLSGHNDYAPYKSCPGELVNPIIDEHLSSSLLNEAEDDVQTYAQCVVGLTDADIEAGRVLAAAYDIALVKAVGESKIVTEQGEEARGGFGFVIGSAQRLVRPEHFPDGGLVIAGADRTETAALIAKTLLKHPPGSIARRGKPW